MIINKNLKTIPFDKLYHIYEEAANAAVEGLEQQLELEYQAKVEQLEHAYTDDHEAPSEVSLADQVVRGTYNKSEVRRRAGNKAITDIWIPRYKLSSLLISVMPQIMAYVAQKPFLANEFAIIEGQPPKSYLNNKKVLQHAFDFNSEWDRGLYYFLMLDSRSSYLPSQYKGDGRQFCALVPLIPYAFKLHHKIPYSRWDRTTLHWVVNPSLADAMLYIPEKKFTREEILVARELGLVYQSGNKKGESRNAQSSFKLWATKGGCLEKVPPLAQVMYSQIWCAHPQNRSHYMVLDPSQWDTMPTPLIPDAIFMPVANNTPAYSSTETDTPWGV